MKAILFQTSFSCPLIILNLWMWGAQKLNFWNTLKTAIAKKSKLKLIKGKYGIDYKLTA